jgi:hypothetical protein
MPSIKTQVIVDESSPELLAELEHLSPRSRAERVRALATAAILMRGQSQMSNLAGAAAIQYGTIEKVVASTPEVTPTPAGPPISLPTEKDPSSATSPQQTAPQLEPQRARRQLPSSINATMS